MSLSLWYVIRRSGAAHPEELGGDVVLYTSVDSNLIQPIMDEFERQTGIHARVVGDNRGNQGSAGAGGPPHLRADQTPGGRLVVQRTGGDHRPCLAGILEPFVSKAEADFKEGWPTSPAGQGQDLVRLCPAGPRDWVQLQPRQQDQRSCTTLPANLTKDSKWRQGGHGPSSVRDDQDADRGPGLQHPWRRRPRGRMASGIVGQWRPSLRRQRSAVASALANGEIEVGLTDTDDVWAGAA